MPSPKSGSAGSIVSPTAPTDPKDADDAKPGDIQDATNSGSKSGGAGSSVKVDDPPAYKPDDDPNKTHWIGLQLVYESNGLPVVGMYYEVTLPDGTTVASGSTDPKGMARVDQIDAGTCQISFPLLDKEAWDDA